MTTGNVGLFLGCFALDVGGIRGLIFQHSCLEMGCDMSLGAIFKTLSRDCLALTFRFPFCSSRCLQSVHEA